MSKKLVLEGYLFQIIDFFDYECASFYDFEKVTAILPCKGPHRIVVRDLAHLDRLRGVWPKPAKKEKVKLSREDVFELVNTQLYSMDWDMRCLEGNSSSVAVLIEKNNKYYFGKATLRKGDIFDYQAGRMLALTRALKRQDLEKMLLKVM